MNKIVIEREYSESWINFLRKYGDDISVLFAGLFAAAFMAFGLLFLLIALTSLTSDNLTTTLGALGMVIGFVFGFDFSVYLDWFLTSIDTYGKKGVWKLKPVKVKPKKWYEA